MSQKSFDTFSIYLTHAVSKNVKIFIPTTNSEQDIDKKVNRTLNKFNAGNTNL